MKRHEITEEQFARILPMLPPEEGGMGRPQNEHRTMINGMLWIAKTGAPWRDLPERYGPWNSVYTRFNRWSKNGLWSKIVEALMGEEAEDEMRMLDSTIVRAHQHASGAQGGL